MRNLLYLPVCLLFVAILSSVSTADSLNDVPSQTTMRQISSAQVEPLAPPQASEAEPPVKSRTWADNWRAGGPLLWPIAAAALIALVLTLERAWFLLRSHPAPAALASALENLNNDNEQKLRTLAQKSPRSPACRMVLAGIDMRGKPAEALENSLMERLLAEQTRLERFLPTLSVLAAVTPLLGLLGTVTGMMKTFQALGFSRGTEPALLSGGIAEALITTQWGLAVAIAIMLAHHLLERRSERLLADMEERASALAAALLDSKTSAGENVRAG